MTMRPLFQPVRGLTLMAWLSVAAACSDNTLASEAPRIRIIPQPEGSQLPLTTPVGIDLGQVPLFGVGTARFAIANDAATPLRIASATIQTATGGNFAVERFSPEVGAYAEDGFLEVSFVPEAADRIGEATLTLATNAGEAGHDQVNVRVRGIGLWVGDPTLRICYDGNCYPTAACPDRGDGITECLLPTLAFGNVPLGNTATQELRLENAPPANTCLLPPGTPACTPVCRLTFAPNPAGENLGFGFAPADQGFAMEGNIALPFAIDSANAACGVAGEIRVLTQFAAGPVERDGSATLVLETDDPAARVVRIPVTGSARIAPVAIATPVDCAVTPPPNCTVLGDVQPLDRVYLDGTQSYDPRDPLDPTLIRHHSWSIIDYPTGANPYDFAVQGQEDARFSFWLPLAGRYRVRLTVANELGIESGVSDSSDVEINAIPDSRVHIQLVWDNPENDQDLHVTHADAADSVCDLASDCYWGNCRPSCPEGEGCQGPAPQWFAGVDLRTGPNPRLDIDDTAGFGPENINIDEPAPGSYRVYVHYYGAVDLDNTPTQATVRLYIDGQLLLESRRVLHRNDLWRVAELQWRNDGTHAVVTPTSDGLGEGQAQPMLGCTQGFNFGPWW